MGKFTVAKIISLLIFMITFIFFLIWMINYSTDLAIIFGFRTSNVVANDIAGRISSLAAVNGEGSVEYNVGSDSEQGASYDIHINNYIVCVNSVAASTKISDCASHPFILENLYEGKGLTNTKLKIEKFYDTTATKYKIRIISEAG